MRGHQDWVRGIAFSPNGQHVATASDDGSARIWPADGIGEPLILRGHTRPIRSVAFSPDGQRVASWASRRQPLATDTLDASDRMTEAGI